MGKTRSTNATSVWAIRAITVREKCRKKALYRGILMLTKPGKPPSRPSGPQWHCMFLLEGQSILR